MSDDTFNEVAKRRIRRTSNKSEKQLREEYAEQTTSPYESLRLDDPYFEEKAKVRNKIKPFYDRLEKKQS